MESKALPPQDEDTPARSTQAGQPQTHHKKRAACCFPSIPRLSASLLPNTPPRFLKFSLNLYKICTTLTTKCPPPLHTEISLQLCRSLCAVLAISSFWFCSPPLSPTDPQVLRNQSQSPPQTEARLRTPGREALTSPRFYFTDL